MAKWAPNQYKGQMTYPSCPFPHSAGDLGKEVNEKQVADLDLQSFEVEMTELW